MFSLIILIVFMIAVVCMLCDKSLMLTLLIIAVVLLMISSVVMAVVSGMSTIYTLMVGGAMFDTFLLWLMSASTWGLSAGMLAFIARIQPCTSDSLPAHNYHDISEEQSIDSYIQKRVQK